jgi:hypothetical protein
VAALALAVTASAGSGASAVSGPVPAGAQSPTAFAASGIDGGGFVNVVAVDPRRTGVVLAGGDVSGIQRSTDWGRSWSVSDKGFNTSAELKVAALAYAPDNPDTVYAAAGSDTGGGGFARSGDGGRTWAFVSRVPQFSGGNNGGGLPSPHPRSTGNLLAADPRIAGLVYAATFDGGVMRSTDGGATWVVLGLAGTHLRSLVLDPGNPEVLYAASFGAGVYRTSSARSTGAFVRLAAAPTTVEELVLVGSELYAAAGSAGLFRSADAGANWTAMATGTTGGVWAAIAGADGPAGRVLYAGAATSGNNGSGRVPVLRSDDGGATWVPLTQLPGGVHANEVGGPGGPPWWLAGTSPDSLLGGAHYVAAHLALDPGNPGTVFLAGRAGIWSSADAGRDWYPLVGGLQVTINRDVVVDPGTPGRVYVTNSDWEVLCSTDGLRHVAHCLDVKGVAVLALAVDASVAPAPVYTGVGNPDRSAKGEVYSNADPVAGGPWRNEGLGKKAGGNRPLAVTAGRDGGSAVILAAVERSGVWRKAGGVWIRVSTAAMGGRQPSGAASFSWIPGSPSVYLYDDATGVWRSNDRGRTWSKIWARPAGSTAWGHLAADPADPSRLYVSVPGDGLYRLDGVTQGVVGAGISATEVGAFSAPGPLAFGPGGTLLATESAGPASTPALRLSTDAGATWQDIGDTAYRAAARLPLGLAVDPGGAIFAALRGTGALVAPGE